MKKWYVVVDSWANEDNYDNAIWTVSDKPDEPGWETDSGCPSYGLLKAEAEELANAANEAPALRAEIARLREALRFYAEPWKYTDCHGDDVRVPDFYSELDFGETARAALSGEEEKS